MKNPGLQTSSEVQRAVERKDKETGEKMPNDPAERIEAYTERLENIFLNPNPEIRKRNLEMFRDKIYDALIIKKENFPESYFELQKRVARERGQAIEEIPETTKEQMKDVVIEDQKHSLDAWIDYLTSEDAVYPAWYKYFVWRNIIKLSQFDKEKGEFKKRTDTTVAPFPDIYREPLAQIADIYEKVKEDNKNLKEPEIKEAFSKKFPVLYAELIQKSLVESIENKEEVNGEWVKYEQGKENEAEKLFNSLEGKGTGWCTAGKSTAEYQIKSGDFYVYYSNDKDNNPTQPRLAIRMSNKDKIGEIRGILPHQNVEPIMQNILNKKLSEFGKEADIYKKKSLDMKKLTEIENKTKNNEKLNKDELVFLYEMNSPIEGFGYEKDPRIEELKKGRNVKEDLAVICECKEENILFNFKELSSENGQINVSMINNHPEIYYPFILNPYPINLKKVLYPKKPTENQIGIYFSHYTAETYPHIKDWFISKLEDNDIIADKIKINFHDFANDGDEITHPQLFKILKNANKAKPFTLAEIATLLNNQSNLNRKNYERTSPLNFDMNHHNIFLIKDGRDDFCFLEVAFGLSKTQYDFHISILPVDWNYGPYGIGKFNRIFYKE